MRFKAMLLMSVFALLTSIGFAQTGGWSPGDLNDDSNRLMGKLTGTIYYLPSGEGAYFLQDEWVEGSVVLEDQDLFDHLQMRYLTLADELVVYNSNLNQLVMVDKEKVKSFTFRNASGAQIFVKLHYDAIVEAGDRYFELKYKGTRWLLAYHYLIEEKTSLYRDYHGKLKDSRLKPKIVYYLYSPENQKFVRMQLKRSSLLSLFSDNRKDVRHLFRQNGLRKFNEQEMIRAFQLLDQKGFL